MPWKGSMEKNNGSMNRPDHQRGSWRFRTARWCERWKAGSLGWQTSCGRPEWAERCCSGRTWWMKNSGKLKVKVDSHSSTFPASNGKNFQWGFIFAGCSSTTSFSLMVTKVRNVLVLCWNTAHFLTHFAFFSPNTAWTLHLAKPTMLLCTEASTTETEQLRNKGEDSQ